MKQTDVIIVGAGPIGIELAVALKKTGVDYLHFDARQIGYTVSWFAPQTRFFSSNERIAIAGVPLSSSDQSKSTREQYLAYLRDVVQLFDLAIQTYEPVTNIQRQPEGDFIITTSPQADRQQYRAKHIVLATGGTAVPRKLDIPGENLPHVSPYFTDPHLYFHKNLMIIGGRNSAVEAAIRCYHTGARISLSYRRDALPAKSIKYWLYPEIDWLIRAQRVDAHFSTQPVEIKPGAVTLRRTDGTMIDVPADFVLKMIGYEADMSLCKLAGVELDGQAQVPMFDEQTMQTSVPSIYVCGTVIGGTQERYHVFIENCHIHVERIMAAICGKPAPRQPVLYNLPES